MPIIPALIFRVSLPPSASSRQAINRHGVGWNTRAGAVAGPVCEGHSAARGGLVVVKLRYLSPVALRVVYR